MRLTRIFMLTTGLLLTLVAIMLIRNLLQEWETYRASREGLAAMQSVYLVLKSAEKASFERGPTNGVLGDAAPPDPAKRERLFKARQATDQAFSDTLAVLTEAGHPDLQAARVLMEKAQSELVVARREVERIAGLPRGERRRPEVMGAVMRMFGVVDVILEAATLVSGRAERIHPELTDALVSARHAAELREYAGRLGSQFTAALTENQPLSPVEVHNISFLEGRIEQLRRQIEVRSRAGDTDPRLREAMAEINARYFGTALAFVAEVKQASATGRPYGMDTAGFAARYVPDMASIVKLRDAMMDVAAADGRKRHAAARDNLILNAAIGVAVLLIEIAVFLFIRWRVLQPLLRGTRTLVNIAGGKLDVPAPVSPRRDEIGAMLNAVAKLKDTSLDKKRLEQERESLIGELQTASRVDYLTGLLNRRAFADAMHQQLSLARRQNWSIAMIIFDLDHFKLINDRFGHGVGDTVLVEVAAIAMREFRQGDIVSRHGGEEFAALAVNCSAEDAVALAERVRMAIAMRAFPLPDGKTLNVTASFGLVALPATAIADIDVVFQRADLALYAAKHNGRNRVTVAA